MSRRRIRVSVWEVLLPLVVLAVGLVLTVGELTPQGRAFVRAAGRLLRLGLVAVALGGILAGVVWLIRRRQGRREAVPAEVGPEAGVVDFPSPARVVDFPPEAGVVTDLKSQLPSPPEPRPGPLPESQPKYRPKYQLRSVEAAAPRPAPPGPSKPAVPTTRELVEQLRGLDGFHFEQVTVTVYEGLGYEVSRGASVHPDGGIDLVVEKLGERTAIQCQHWQARQVEVNNVQEFLGALARAQIHNGIFIALAGAAAAAKELARAHDINILTDADLAQLLDRAGARFNPAILAALSA